MPQLQFLLIQLERAKSLIREEIQAKDAGKTVEALKLLELITTRLVTLDALPHRL